ncbi:hypothetical protein HK104_002892 [Borealophlyctis nickersoniae]|nr:hypothetical protein HK104_002892 [Borealophlyctis nickersoniae]
METEEYTSDLFSDSTAPATPLPSSPDRFQRLIPPDFSSPIRLYHNDEDEETGDAGEWDEDTSDSCAPGGLVGAVEESPEKEEGVEPKPTFTEKQQWINAMRLKFCVRKEFEITKNIVHEDGTLNQDYFRPPKGTKLHQEEARRWTDKERNLLIKGIEKHGIGHFREISEELLPDWSGNDLRVRTIRLIGRQNLQLYKDWKGREEDIKAEYERNKEIGMRLGAWKAGVLVYDDDGKVLEALQASGS